MDIELRRTTNEPEKGCITNVIFKKKLNTHRRAGVGVAAHWVAAHWHNFVGASVILIGMRGNVSVINTEIKALPSKLPTWRGAAGPACPVGADRASGKEGSGLIPSRAPFIFRLLCASQKMRSPFDPGVQRTPRHPIRSGWRRRRSSIRRG